MTTAISWTHREGTTGETWNPVRATHRETGATGWACVRVSPGCVNCYAATLNQARRWNTGTGEDYTVPALERVDVAIDEHALRAPLRWREPRTVFVCSMTDLFGEWVSDAMLDRIFAAMALAPQHTFLCLTKRADRMRQYMTQFWGVATGNSDARLLEAFTSVMAGTPSRNVVSYERALSQFDWPLPNVWLGVSAEGQQRADERIPLLLDTPAAIRFVSAEPMLGGIWLRQWLPDVHHDRCQAWDIPGHPHDETTLDWVIVGGESGKGYRPMERDWALSIREQCAAAGVPLFEKQRSDYRNEQPYPPEWGPMVRQWPEVSRD